MANLPQARNEDEGARAVLSVRALWRSAARLVLSRLLVRLIEVLQPGVDLLFGLLLHDAVALDQGARELVALASEVLDVIVGELSPLRPDLTLELIPLTFDLRPVHDHLLLS